MLITALKPLSQNRYTVTLEDGREFKSNLNVITDYRLFAGKDINEAEAEEISSASVYALCYERAVYMLGMRAMSRQELVRKLIQKGESPDAAEHAAAKAEEHGFINDVEYASMLVRRYAGKGYGTGRIRQEMKQRGVSRELWDGAFAEMPEQDDKIDKYVKSRLTDPSDRKQVKKVCDGLARKGYSWSEIKDALERFKADTDDIYEET